MWLNPADYTGRAGIAVEFHDDYTLLKFADGNNIAIPLKRDGSLSDGFKGRLPRFAFEHVPTKVYKPEVILKRVILDRLRMIKDYKLPDHGLLKLDLLGLLSNTVHIKPITPNAIRKFDSRIVILDIKDYKNGRPLGDFVRPNAHKKDARGLERILNTFDASPSSASTPPKGVLNIFLAGEDRYSAIGYTESDKGYQTIFNPVKPLAERFKGHVIADAIEVENPDKSILPFKGSDTAKYIINAVAVFLPAYDEKGSDNKGTNAFRFACGEIRCARRLAEMRALPINVKLIFADEIFVESNKVVHRDEPIGKLDDEFVKISTAFQTFKVLSVLKMPGEKQWKLEIQGSVPVAASRIVSQTGLKGMTLPVSNLGSIQYNGTKLKVDLACGPNNLKAKGNTIALAQLGLYAKVNGNVFNVNNMTETEINAICDSVGKVTYTDENGHQSQVYAGVIPIQVTELSSETSSHNPVKVLPETIMNLSRLGYNDLVDEILFEGVDSKYPTCLAELFAILYDRANKSGLPVLKPNDPRLINALKGIQIDSATFGQDKGEVLFMKKTNKGFFLDLDGQMVRMPSAELIEALTDCVEHTGEYRYPSFLRPALRILMNIQQQGPDLIKNIRRNLVTFYYHIYSELLGKNRVINRCCTAYLPGFTAKQLVDPRIPVGITVCFDERIGKLVSRTALLEMGVRNPVLWTGQIETREVWGEHDLQNLCDFHNWDINTIAIPELSRHIILRNPYDALKSQSDCDGDLHPMAIPSSEHAQSQLSDTICNPALDIEADWLDIYIKGEIDNSVYDDVKFKWYSINRKDFAHSFIGSCQSKIMIGPATTSLWAYEAMMELELGRVDTQKMMRFNYFYQRLVQDTVVRGIKHSEGSADFSGLLMHNITAKDKDGNWKAASAFLKVGATIDEVNEILDIINRLNSTSSGNPEDAFKQTDMDCLRMVISAIVGSLSIKENKDLNLDAIANPAITSHRALLEEVTPVLRWVLSEGTCPNIKELLNRSHSTPSTQILDALNDLVKPDEGVWESTDFDVSAY